ncbi:hypothetical protein G9A89_003534 [Geosiphon pyriformis]|nr:hypothetical protein G9A89_003534 [Geosiphon pyriformis]
MGKKNVWVLLLCGVHFCFSWHEMYPTQSVKPNNCQLSCFSGPNAINSLLFIASFCFTAITFHGAIVPFLNAS